MKRPAYILPLIVVLLAAAASCENTLLSLNGMDDRPIMVMNILPGLGDTTVLVIDIASPVGNAGSEGEASIDHISITADGKEVKLERNDGSASGLEIGMLFTDQPFPPGCRLDISASGAGIPPAKAATTIPEAFPEFSCDLEWTKVDPGTYGAYPDMSGKYQLKSPDVVRMNLKFTDNAETEDFYGVMIVPEEMVFHNDELSGINICESSYVKKGYNSLSVDKDRLVMIFNPRNHFGKSWNKWPLNSFVIFSDFDFNGKQAEKEFLFINQEDYTYSENPATRYEFRYRLLLLRLSEEFYRYAESSIIYQTSDLMQFGQAPYFPYTNVAGGAGTFSGLTVTDAGYLDIPEK